MIQSVMRLWIKAYCFLVLLIVLGTKPTLAQSVTTADDGTGTIVNTANGEAQISGGTQAGSNLFHSFEQFGLDSGEIANFISNPNIDNILGRVVGGDVSAIDGLIQMTGGPSNLFLINPAGILFGPNARLNIPADFTATTANGIQIDDSWFNAMGSNNYASLVGAPSGFAFTNDAPGAVINAGHLSASPGESVTLLGGFVVNTGTLETAGGNITIAAVPGENMISITPEGSLLSLGLPVEGPAGLDTTLSSLTADDIPLLLSGEGVAQNLGIVIEDNVVTLANTNTAIPTNSGTTIAAGTLNVANVTANGTGGSIDVLGDRVGLVDATLVASGTNDGGNVRIGGDYQGQGSVPNAELTYISEGSRIAATALAQGDGGEVIVWADDITEFYGDITARGGSSAGNGGFVEVSGRENLAFHGQVDVTAVNGSHGILLLDPRNIFIVKSEDALVGGDEGLRARPSILASDGDTVEDFTISDNGLRNTSGTVILQASNNIQVEPGTSLTFQPGEFPDPHRFIIFEADHDQDGRGDFLMDQNQTINASQSNLMISGVSIETGDITAESLSLRASSDGQINTGHLTVNGITRLEADRGNISAESVTVGPLNIYIGSGFSNVFSTSTREIEGFELFGRADTSFIDNAFLELGASATNTILDPSAQTYRPSRPRMPAVSITTNSGRIRITDDIKINAREVIFYGEVSDSSNDPPPPPGANRNNLLAIRHGGVSAEIAPGLALGGGNDAFGFVLGAEVDEGLSGVGGEIVFEYALEGLEIRQPNGSPSIYTGNIPGDLFSVKPIRIASASPNTASRESSPIARQPNLPTSPSPLDRNLIARQPNLPTSSDAPETDTVPVSQEQNIENTHSDRIENGFVRQEEERQRPDSQVCNSFQSTEMLDVTSIVPEDCKALSSTIHDGTKPRLKRTLASILSPVSQP